MLARWPFALATVYSSIMRGRSALASHLDVDDHLRADAVRAFTVGDFDGVDALPEALDQLVDARSGIHCELVGILVAAQHGERNWIGVLTVDRVDDERERSIARRLD